MTPSEIAWAAGFYEGEGSCVAHLNKRGARRYSYLHISIPQVEMWPLEKWQKLFGGKLSKRSRGCWQWQLTGKAAEAVLNQLYPHLSPKRQLQITTARAAVAAKMSCPEFRQSFGKIT